MARGTRGGYDHRHAGYGGRYYSYYGYGRRPAWAIYIGPYGLGFGYGYPGFGAYYGGLWGYGHYYDYAYAPGVYSDSVYYAPAIVDEAYETLEPPEDSSQVDSQSVRDGERFLVEAETAFREGRYQDSVALSNHAVVEFPNDGRVMLFLSQSLFAVGDYQGAITAAYRGMSLLPTEDWGFVVQNYQKYYGKDDYVSQMDKLNAYVKSNPDAAYARALRGYQFGFLGHEEQARKDLGKAIELEKRDEFAARLLNQFGGHAELPPPEPPPDAVGPAETDPGSEATRTPQEAPANSPDGR